MSMLILCLCGNFLISKTCLLSLGTALTIKMCPAPSNRAFHDLLLLWWIPLAFNTVYETFPLICSWKKTFSKCSHNSLVQWDYSCIQRKWQSCGKPQAHPFHPLPPPTSAWKACWFTGTDIQPPKYDFLPRILNEDWTQVGILVCNKQILVCSLNLTAAYGLLHTREASLIGLEEVYYNFLHLFL